VDRATNVLVVDDDKAIVELLRDFLEAEGFHVEGALDAGQAQEILDRVPVDCVLLDVMMPGQSGFDLVRQIRQGSRRKMNWPKLGAAQEPTSQEGSESDVPVLFLSARGADSDKIRGLGLGGDDYIVKSATPSEVVARVKAVLRRSGRGEPIQNAHSALFDFGRLVLDVRAREVRVNGEIVPFTPKEFDLLRLFAEQPRQVFTYEQLIDRLWGEVGDRHTVTVHVERIRKKIEEDPGKPKLIVNVWGVGYRFEGKKL
jgi:DNA-binding response OmpR family regulator